jgi:hypothetical protein
MPPRNVCAELIAASTTVRNPRINTARLMFSPKPD